MLMSDKWRFGQLLVAELNPQEKQYGDEGGNWKVWLGRVRVAPLGHLHDVTRFRTQLLDLVIVGWPRRFGSLLLSVVSSVKLRARQI
jgi:hypothetical protein